jgi:hypothetical protein
MFLVSSILYYPWMKKTLLLPSFFLVSLILFSSQVKADWINLTGAETAPNIAEIYVMDDHVKVQLEVFVGDLETFAALVPDSWMTEADEQRPDLEQRMQEFATQTFSVLDEDGKPLPAELTLVEPRMRVDRQSPFAGMINPYTKQRIPDAPADKRVVYAEIIYPFKEKPEQLQISPPLDESGKAMVTLGFIAYHRSVPIIDFRYLGQPENLNLNWRDPWYTTFENKNLTRHHKYPLMLFLYVEPRQVRLESLMRIRDIVEMTNFDLSKMGNNAAKLKLHDHVKDYFLKKSVLNIDDTPVNPATVTVRYFIVSVTGLKPVDNPSTMDDASMLVGVSRQYYIDTLPQRIQSTWPYFNPRFDQIPLVEIDPAGPLPGFISQDDPVIDWQNQLKKYHEPVMRSQEATTGWRITLPFIGQKTFFNRVPNEQQAMVIVGDVLENLRVAYLEKNPAASPRQLEKILTKDHADALATELSKLFAPAMKRGGVGEVKSFADLTIKDIQPISEQDGFRAITTGSAIIQAMHWGHTDQLQVQFQLLLDLVEVDNQWRLTDVTVIDLKGSK